MYCIPNCGLIECNMVWSIATLILLSFPKIYLRFLCASSWTHCCWRRQLFVRWHVLLTHSRAMIALNCAWQDYIVQAPFFFFCLSFAIKIYCILEALVMQTDGELHLPDTQDLKKRPKWEKKIIIWCVSKLLLVIMYTAVPKEKKNM